MNMQAIKCVSFIFFPHPLLTSSSLKVPAVSLPSFQRMTPSPMTPVTPTAVAVRVTMLTRKHSCWMSHWRGQPAPLMPTVQPRLLAQCSGLLETPLARGPLEMPLPAPQHQLVSKALSVFVRIPHTSFMVPVDNDKNCVYNSTCCDLCLFFTASSTGLIYIDPTNLRRSSAISSSAAAAAAALEASNSSSYLTSASSLARAYSIVIRQISDLMSLIPKYNHLVYSQYPAAVKLTYQDAVNLQVSYTAIM